MYWRVTQFSLMLISLLKEQAAPFHVRSASADFALHFPALCGCRLSVPPLRASAISGARE